MQFSDLHFYRAIFRANAADALDAAKGRNIERVLIRAGGKSDHVFRAGEGNQFARTAKGDLFAVVHDGDALAETFGFVHVVGGEKNGAAGGLELLDQFPKLASGLGVEAGGGLIEKKEIGIANEGAGQREALLLTAGKIANARVLFFFELHERDGFGGARPLVKKAAEQTQRFVNRELFRELRVLQLNAEPLAELLGIRAPMHPEQFHVAGIRGRQPFADLDRGGFSRAVGPEKAEALASADFEVQAIDGDHVLVGLAKTRDAQNGAG
jgi:hypothetical protein